MDVQICAGRTTAQEEKDDREGRGDQRTGTGRRVNVFAVGIHEGLYEVEQVPSTGWSTSADNDRCTTANWTGSV